MADRVSTLESAIGFFRRRAEGQFRARGRVQRRSAEGAFDPNTGGVGEPELQTIYEGVCNVREVTWQGTDVSTGQTEIRLRRVMLSFPHDTPIETDDVLTVTAAEHDPDLVDQRYRITDVSLDAWQITRKALGERLTRALESW